MLDTSLNSSENASQPDTQAASASPTTMTIQAVYEDGVIKPSEPLHLPPGTPITLQVAVQVTAQVAVGADAAPRAVEAASPAPEPVAPPAPAAVARERQPWAFRLPERLAALPWARVLTPEMLLFSFGVLVYLLTRFIGLSAFPIYFFSDEAIQANLASDFLQRGLRDHTGTFLPPYFLNDRNWNLSFSIYVHSLPVLLFGKSVVITRGTSVLVSLLAPIVIALILKQIFKIRFWWLGPLVLSVLPAWFLHSRTAFETVMMVAFYACFLYCYLRYRYEDPRYLYPAIVLGAMTFYSYTNGQGVMLVSGVLLLLSDLRYHLRQPLRRLLLAVGLLALMAVQFVRFRLLYPDAVAAQLQSLDSVWTRPLSFSEKVMLFGQNYLNGLSFGYWFLPNNMDLDRHRWLGLGHLPLLLAPLILLGLWVCLRNWRSSAHRLVLIAVLAAPFSSALVAIAITRVLAMMVPATLLACLGAEQLRVWLARRVPQLPLALGSAALLAVCSFGLLRSALVDAPTWFSDYGLGGMQYGAQQLFGEALPEEMAKTPGDIFLVASSWANNTDTYAWFFLNDSQRAQMRFASVDEFLLYKGENIERYRFVLTSEEYQRAIDSGKFVMPEPERVLYYPNGLPGFYFTRLSYVPGIDEIFQAERAARQELLQETVIVGGQETQVRFSRLDIGEIVNVFDGDVSTLLRGMEANPFVFEFEFSEPRSIGELVLDTAAMEFSLRIIATPATGGEPLITEQVFRGLPGEPHVELPLTGGAQPLSTLRIEITNLNEGDVAHIHVRELQLR